MYLYLLLFVFTLIACNNFMNGMVFLLIVTSVYYVMRSCEKLDTNVVADVEAYTNQLMK